MVKSHAENSRAETEVKVCLGQSPGQIMTQVYISIPTSHALNAMGVKWEQ